jgi:thioredoxin 1
MIITLIVLSALVLVFTAIVIYTKRKMKSVGSIPDSTKIKVLTDQNFPHKIKNGMALVDFWASWCMPCKLMVPTLNELADQMDGKVMIGKVNIDESKATAAKFGVRSIPTMILFRNGKEIHRFVGVKSKDYLLRELDRRSLN